MVRSSGLERPMGRGAARRLPRAWRGDGPPALRPRGARAASGRGAVAPCAPRRPFRRPLIRRRASFFPLTAVAEVFPHQDQAGQEGPAEPLHRAVDPLQDQQHHPVSAVERTVAREATAGELDGEWRSGRPASDPCVAPMGAPLVAAAPRGAARRRPTCFAGGSFSTTAKTGPARRRGRVAGGFPGGEAAPGGATARAARWGGRGRRATDGTLRGAARCSGRRLCAFVRRGSRRSGDALRLRRACGRVCVCVARAAASGAGRRLYPL